MLSKPDFLKRLEQLRAARLVAATDSAHGFYDAELLGWLDAAAKRRPWAVLPAFQEVAGKVLRGPLDLAALRRMAAASSLPAETAAAQIGHRLHGLMAAFSPAECFDDPSQPVSGATELVRSSEADLARCRPFVQALQRGIEHLETSASQTIDMIDAGCGPHLFWSLLALCMSERVRVCAIERDPLLARQARAFAAALGVAQRIRVIEADASRAAVALQIADAFAGGAAPFVPRLIVSETHSPLMFEEAGDQILRNLKRLFPAAMMLPEGVEIVGAVVDAQRLRDVMAETDSGSFARMAGIAEQIAQYAQVNSLGRFMASDSAADLRLDAQGRRCVGPLAVHDAAGTPVFGTRLLFPLEVPPLAAGESLGITEWLWTVQPAPGLQTSGQCHLVSIFMQPAAHVVTLSPQQSCELSYVMGAEKKPFTAIIQSKQPTSQRKHTMQNTDTSASPSFEIMTSRHLLAWLAEQKLSIALTTYQIGKLFLLGLKGNGELSIFERTFNRCMGLCPTANGFYMSSLPQVWRFENLFTHGELQDGYDRLYVPQVGNTTGDLDIHDMAVDANGQLVFVNTLFGCLATLSETHSFKPLWRPRFLSKLAAEDRCHLNGLAMKDGHPAYVTAVGESDVVDGWRQHRAGGGVVIDVNSSETVAGGLSMPHSPRWHQGKLWLLNSGTGEFGHIELDTGRFVPLTFCAGYMRGLYFHGDYALVGLSKARQNRTFSGLALDENLKSRKAEARCGVQIIDLRTGDAVHWFNIEGVVDELYDVITLPGVRRPMALGFKTDEIQRVLSIEE